MFTARAGGTPFEQRGASSPVLRSCRSVWLRRVALQADRCTLMIPGKRPSVHYCRGVAHATRCHRSRRVEVSTWSNAGREQSGLRRSKEGRREMSCHGQRKRVYANKRQPKWPGVMAFHRANPQARDAFNLDLPGCCIAVGRLCRTKALRAKSPRGEQRVSEHHRVSYPPSSRNKTRKTCKTNWLCWQALPCHPATTA